MGVSFQFRHPKDARACNRPQSGQRPVDRHKEFPSLWKHCSWGCSIICKNMVPFHDLWTDGGETEKRPPCPSRVIEPTQNYGSYFWDTTLAGTIGKQFSLLLSEFQPDGYMVEFKMLPQLIEHEPFVGKMDFVGSVCKDHKGGRPDTGLGGIKKFETP